MSPRKGKPIRVDDTDDRTLKLVEANNRERRLLELEEIQQALREELRDWLNEQFITFGKWSLKGIAALALAGLVYLFIVTHGWKAPL